MKKKKEYLSNKEFTQKIIEFQKSNKDISELPEDLIKMFQLLIKRISNRINFSSYTWLEDMRSEALLNCLEAFYKFDPEKSNNAFAYFSSIIFNSFKQYLNNEKNYKITKEFYQEYLEIDPRISQEVKNYQVRKTEVNE